MPTASPCDYAIIRVVPAVERGEFINAGLIVFCRPRRFLQAEIALDTERLRALAPYADTTLIAAHLASMGTICRGGQEAGPIGALPLQERFHWLVAPRSTMIQTSPVHPALSTDPAKLIQQLMQWFVYIDRSSPPQA
ncbi:MAG: DUF3037 domain-containing protein [Herpetosiphonaceae bacterium]|nr:DUF3037 domain-containing protein [Herpetosiphonaceae bacterium]